MCQVSDSNDSFCDGLARAWNRAVDPIQSRVGGACGTIAHGVGRTAGAVANFIKNNWKTLLAYTVAWAIILTCAGFTYGFQAVTLPLAIGMACGVAFGALIGIATVKIFDPQNRFSGRNSAWGLINGGTEPLDTGTRQLLFPVAVTVILATAVVFPHAVGVGIGIFLGNQLAIQAGYGPDPLRTKYDELHERVRTYSHQIVKLQEEPSATPRTFDAEIEGLKVEYKQLRSDIFAKRYESHDLLQKISLLREHIDNLEQCNQKLQSAT